MIRDTLLASITQSLQDLKSAVRLTLTAHLRSHAPCFKLPPCQPWPVAPGVDGAALESLSLLGTNVVPPWAWSVRPGTGARRTVGVQDVESLVFSPPRPLPVADLEAPRPDPLRPLGVGRSATSCG